MDVKIARLMPYGAFAEIMPGVDGLIHISQISDKHITKPADALKVGDSARAKIVEINAETKKINLSIRALIETTDENIDDQIVEQETEKTEE